MEGDDSQNECYGDYSQRIRSDPGTEPFHKLRAFPPRVRILLKHRNMQKALKPCGLLHQQSRSVMPEWQRRATDGTCPIMGLFLKMISASVDLPDVLGREREGPADAWPQLVYLAAFASGIMSRTALAASAAS
jgi:hypothetical protein